MARDLDLLLVGATGFTGARAARYLAEHGAGLALGFLGRDAARLERLTGSAERLVVDLTDREAVARAVGRARVVASTAGPFARLGDAVVDACVEYGAHYCDITGETPWARRVIDRHHARARAEGTRLVPFAGFDSVPADLACLRLAREADGRLGDVDAVYALAGGLNGGTLASALHLAEHEDPRSLADPWILVPGASATHDERTRLRDPRKPARVDGHWVVPFFMAAINSRVVRRSHALSSAHPPPDEDGRPRPLAGYGEHFRYREWQAVGGGRAGATGASWMLRLGNLALGTRTGRALFRRFGPEPGEGPSDAVIERGRTCARFVAQRAEGESLRRDLHADGDPGNEATVLFLCETALALCGAPPALGLGAPGTGGALTPALALGEHLLARLERTGRFVLG